MTNIERAAEVIEDETGMWSLHVAHRLAAEGLLVTDEQVCPHIVSSDDGTSHCTYNPTYDQYEPLTDEQQRLIRLGEAVERVRRLALDEGGDGDAIRVYDWIYNEAERGET